VRTPAFLGEAVTSPGHPLVVVAAAIIQREHLLVVSKQAARTSSPYRAANPSPARTPSKHSPESCPKNSASKPGGPRRLQAFAVGAGVSDVFLEGRSAEDRASLRHATNARRITNDTSKTRWSMG